MGRLFGTDGVRGIANTELSPLLAFKLGRAGAKVLSKLQKRPLFVVGKDTRISGDMLEAALTAGICSAGADVIKVGIVPTPAVAYLTRFFNADAGVVISASHNPVEYNGIKFFDKNGYKLPDAMEDDIEALLDDANQAIESPTGSDVGKIIEKGGVRPYVDFIKSAVSKDFSDLTVALDCANGASYEVAPVIFEELGAKVHVINNTPDGCNINANCGSTHPDALCQFVREVGADVEHFPEFYEKNIGAMLRGGVGTGKTFFACCIANELINRGYTAYVTSMPEILTYMAVGEERRHVMDKVLTADLLVLDDWGVERDTSYAVEQVYYVIDSRLKMDKPMLITTNLSEEDLHSAPSLSLQRIYDRVLEVCPFIIEINTGSRRPQSADKKRKELFEILGKGIDKPNI